MRKIKIGSTDLIASRIAYGCMNIADRTSSGPITETEKKNAFKAIDRALEEGINFFDHADIYARGKSEKVFSGIWNEMHVNREDIIIQSKCGIRPGDGNSPGRYDFSSEYIVSSVEEILKRLKTGYLDILLLHRPDPLMEPEEVASAFDRLKSTGSVRHFGISNHNRFQIELLKKYLNVPLVANQVEFNPLHSELIDEAVVFNQGRPENQQRGQGTMEYMRLQDIQMQAWSPLCRGLLSGRNLDGQPENVLQCARLISEIAEQKNCTKEAVIIAWILRHPAHIMPVIGTLNPERIRAACSADAVEMSREDWYRIFISGRGAPMP